MVYAKAMAGDVAPRAGAWIEAVQTLCTVTAIAGRSPCGSVD